MIMNELNTNLIEAAKEKFPAKGQLAKYINGYLYMGKEAIYRSCVAKSPLHFRKQPLFQKNWGYPWTELPELASATMQCSISM